MLELLRDHLNSEHAVFTDNFYNSADFTVELLEAKYILHWNTTNEPKKRTGGNRKNKTEKRREKRKDKRDVFYRATNRRGITKTKLLPISKYNENVR